MFGHPDNNDQQHQAGQPEPHADATLSAPTPTAAPPLPTSPAVDANEVDEALKALNASTPEEETTPAPAETTEPAVETEEPAAEPTPEPETAPEATEEPAPAIDLTDNRGEAPVMTDTDTATLLDLKASALQQLAPLIDQLEQAPEERFRTTMMMIQASDDQSLLQSAYEAAQQIEDEKVKAQALLDVVNEINYFTQQPAAEA